MWWWYDKDDDDSELNCDLMNLYKHFITSNILHDKYELKIWRIDLKIWRIEEYYHEDIINCKDYPIIIRIKSDFV